MSVALDQESLVIDGSVLIRNVPRQHHEHRFEHFMGDGDNRLLGPPRMTNPRNPRKAEPGMGSAEWEMVQRDDPAICHGTEWGVFMTGGMADHIPVFALPRLYESILNVTTTLIQQTRVRRNQPA